MLPTSDNTATQIALLIQEMRLGREATDRYQAGQAKILDDIEKRLRDMEDAVATLKERLTMWQIFQTSFTALMGGVIALFKH